MDTETPIMELDKLAAALAKAQAEFPAIPKTRTATIPTKGGSAYSYQYADLADILTHMRPVLAKNGLAVAQLVNNGLLDTVLLHSSGQRLTSHTILTCAAADPKVSGAELTYRRRHALCAILGIAADDDTDGEGTDGTSEAEQTGKLAGSQERPAEVRAPARRAAQGPAELCTAGERAWIKNRAGDKLNDVLAEVGCDDLAHLTKDQFAAARASLMRAA